ncbi:MAG: DNA mismatch repair protein [Candidatus Heimdallarchaeota archaeon]|nr:DNA mismatch repair protein [Candidatus Heimdallarchaeota archaeon]
MSTEKPYTFEISLSVLNHLGRNLYRSFITVLGEAISNSWDANANNVWIYIDKGKNNFLIKDDGEGMTAKDFQNKFLRIGYSKRKDGVVTSSKGRPFIGRKGIGKLALLSCSDKITVISKKKNKKYVGGSIDNSGLDRAITEDLIPSDYLLERFDLAKFGNHIKNHESGTIILFENIREGVKNSFKYLKKKIALYFRFSLLDESFNIYLNDDKISLDDLDSLAKNTQFLWKINSLDDPYINEKLTNLKKPAKNISMEEEVKGFIASVKLPSHLKLTDTNEKVGVDLFVNGRLRERDILRRIPTDRIVISYLYGQIHLDGLDNEEDRFTSSREGIVADDAKYDTFLKNLRVKLTIIQNNWDKWRLEIGEEGDPENPRVTKKERSSRSLFSAVSEDYKLLTAVPEDPNKKRVEAWVKSLGNDAVYNFSSYAECFISENLVRKHIEEENITLSPEAEKEIEKYKTREEQSKGTGNVSIEIRKITSDLSYLDMDNLANLVDKSRDIKHPGLSRTAREYKPIRDALMHTALLTDEAKSKLETVKNNIKGRVKDLLTGK